MRVQIPLQTSAQTVKQALHSEPQRAGRAAAAKPRCHLDIAEMSAMAAGSSGSRIRRETWRILRSPQHRLRIGGHSVSNVLAIVRHAFELPPNLPWEHKSLPHDQSTSKSFVGLARVEIAGGPGFWEVDHGGICHHDERRFDRSCRLLCRTLCLRLCFAACAFYSASQKAVVFRRRELKRGEASYR